MLLGQRRLHGKKQSRGLPRQTPIVAESFSPSGGTRCPAGVRRHRARSRAQSGTGASPAQPQPGCSYLCRAWGQSHLALSAVSNRSSRWVKRRWQVLQCRYLDLHLTPACDTDKIWGFVCMLLLGLLSPLYFPVSLACYRIPCLLHMGSNNLPEIARNDAYPEQTGIQNVVKSSSKELGNCITTWFPSCLDGLT